MAGTIKSRRSGARFYDQGVQKTYSFAEHDFGAGAATHEIKPPYGCNMGRLVDIEVEVTENFTADTTPGYVQVGNSNDLDMYGELELGLAADAGEVYGSGDDDIFGAAAQDFVDMSRDGAAGVAIDDVLLTFVAPTGGTPAGKGLVNVTMAWW